MPRLRLTALLLAAGCAQAPPPPLALAPAASSVQPVDPSQAHLLLFPETDAESLLGRTVQRSSDRSWTMADARPPGCRVSVTKEAAAFHTSRKVEAHAMTSVAGGYAKVVSLEAKYGGGGMADVQVDNTWVLRADLRGACGALAVDTVLVGRGRRGIEAGAVAGDAGTAPATTTAGRSRSDALSWDDDEAYGFGLRESARSEPLDLRVGLSSAVTEGDDVTARFETKQPTWLVVYAIDDSGRGQVLWPSRAEPEPGATPDAPATLPSEKERAQGIHYPAQLSKPGQPARETLVIYAFADKGDFDAMKPAAESESTDGPGYAAELTMRLQNLPMSRWSRALVGYVIQPKP